MAGDVIQKIISTSTINEGSVVVGANKLGGYEVLSPVDSGFYNRRGYNNSEMAMSGLELRLNYRLDNPTYYG
jgi:hypothetical protein